MNFSQIIALTFIFLLAGCTAVQVVEQGQVSKQDQGTGQEQSSDLEQVTDRKEPVDVRIVKLNRLRIPKACHQFQPGTAPKTILLRETSQRIAGSDANIMFLVGSSTKRPKLKDATRVRMVQRQMVAGLREGKKTLDNSLRSKTGGGNDGKGR